MAEATAKKKATTKAAKKTDTKKKVNPVFARIKSENEKYINSAADVIQQYREFKVPGAEEDRILRVHYPSPLVETQVNQTYSKTYGRLLQDEDFLPEAQIIESMKKRGIWSDEHDTKISRLQERQARLRNLIFVHGDSNTATSAELDKLTEEYEQVSREASALVRKRASFTVNSIETRAYETKIKDQVWRCVTRVVDGEEQPFWHNLDEIDGETDRVLLYRVMNECVSFWQGVPADFLEQSQDQLSGESDTL